MASVIRPRTTSAAEPSGESHSDATRQVIARTEPKSLRTYTPTLAAIAKAAGCYVYTPEGRKLADFTSGVLVANLGHNPTSWWRRLQQYFGHEEPHGSGEFFAGAPLTAYNAITPLEAQACERLLANMRSQPGGGRMEQVMWSASGLVR